MYQTARLDLLGNAMAHPSRARMLCTLMDGRAFTAKELAAAAGITAQTASAHLARLTHAGLICATRSGRHSYHQITNADVADALEQISTLTPAPPRSRAPKELHHARTCYNHLAGHLAVAITGALVDMGLLRHEDGRFATFPSPLWAELGVSLPRRPGKAAFARPCLDWTERRTHIAGPMGIQMLAHFTGQTWLTRQNRAARGLVLTPKGRANLARLLQLEDAALS